MNALVSLALFEIRYHLRQPAIWLYALLLFGQGLWSYQADSTQENSYLLLASLGPMVMLVASVLAGQALTKDLEYQTAAYLYTLPLPDTIWFTGKFIGTYLTVLGLTLFFPAGLLVAGYAHRAPISINELVDAFLKIVVQNVLLVVSVSYACTVFTRRMTGAYLAMFVLGLYALLTQSYRDIVANSDLLKLLDPFGIGIITEAVEQAGGQAPDLSETWLISRLLWLGFTFGLLSRAEERFSYTWFADRPSGKPKAGERAGYPKQASVPIIQPVFDRISRIRLFGQLTRLMFQELTGQVAFRLTLVALILATVGYALFYGQPDYLADSLLPTTARMTALRQPLGLFMGLFLLVWTVELVFRERTTGFWVIYDTLPQPTSLTALAKLTAMLGIAILLILVLFGVGLSLQLINGKTPIDWSLYANDLLIDGLFRYVQLIILAIFVSILTNNRFLSHALSASLLIMLTFLPRLGPSGYAYWRYSFLPGSDQYSDLTGYGQLLPARFAFHGLWWSLAFLLLILAVRNWPRGVVQPFIGRLSAWGSQLTWFYAGSMLLAIGSVAGCCLLINQRQYTSGRFLKSAVSTVKPVTYHSHSESVALRNNRILDIAVTYHHPYNVDLFSVAIQAGLSYGERILGPYPYPGLRLTETPDPSNRLESRPAQLFIPETYGWLADRGHSTDIDFIYYLTVREVLKQWVPNQLRLADAPGRPFLQEGLPEYLSAQALRQRYGPGWLTRQLIRYGTAYTRGRYQATTPECSILQTDASYVGRDRAALVLSSIGQVWGDTNLIRFIGQFYRSAIRSHQPVTAAMFGAQLDHTLPDSLRYLTDYLRKSLYFEFRVSHVSRLPNGISVQVIGRKWTTDGSVLSQGLPQVVSDGLGTSHAVISPNSGWQELLMADYVPIVLLDATGRERYRKLVLLGTGEQAKPIRLPLIPGVTEVVIDPIGAWNDRQSDNHKRLPGFPGSDL